MMAKILIFHTLLKQQSRDFIIFKKTEDICTKISFTRLTPARAHTHDLIVHQREWPLNYSISIPWNFIQSLKEQKKLHKMFKNKKVSAIISTTLNIDLKILKLVKDTKIF